MIRKTLLVGLAGLYILLFGEVFLRVMDPQPLMPRYVVGTDWGIRGNEPSITYRHWTPETETTITTNSLGMRDSARIRRAGGAGRLPDRADGRQLFHGLRGGSSRTRSRAFSRPISRRRATISTC